MDNTAIELTAAILWTVAVVAFPFLSLLISGAIAMFAFGNETAKAADTFMKAEISETGESFKQIAKIQGKGILVVLIGLVIGLALAVLAIVKAVEAWVAFAS